MFRRALIKCWARKTPTASGVRVSACTVVDRRLFRVQCVAATSRDAFSRLADATLRGFAADTGTPAHAAGSVVVQFPLAQTGEGAPHQQVASEPALRLRLRLAANQRLTASQLGSPTV